MSYRFINIAARILYDAYRDNAGSAELHRKKMLDLSDDQLVLQCKGELPYQTAAFEILLNRYRQKIFGKILSMIKNKDEAYDVMQEVSIKIFNGIEKFQMKSSFSTWVYTITVNTCLNYIEKMQRRPWWWIKENVDDVKQYQLEDESLFFQVEDAMEQDDLRKRIEKALGQLSDSAKKIILLRYFQEMDYKSIADELDIGLSAAKMRLKRAREDFRIAYEELAETV